MHARPLLAASAAAAATLVLAACGSEDAAPAGSATAAASAAPTMAMSGMAVLAQATRGDMQIGLEAMAPETFYVSEGAGLREQSPGPTARRHLMVTLTDVRSGIRLPDATVTLRLTGPDGRTAFTGPLYPMVGRGMGMHYGENVPLPATGTYTARLVVGPPRIGRHVDAATAWTTPARLEARFSWDGRAARAAA